MLEAASVAANHFGAVVADARLCARVRADVSACAAAIRCGAAAEFVAQRRGDLHTERYRAVSADVGGPIRE